MSRTFGSKIAGKYTIQNALGQGGFACTYLAIDPYGVRKALKECFRDVLALRKEALVLPISGQEVAWNQEKQYFIQEYKRAYRVEHKHVVRIESLEEDKGTWFMVMRYYEGQTLNKYLKSQPGGCIPEAEMILLMQKILSGVIAIHQQNIVHRDIKPENIIMTPVSRGHEPVIIDFGASLAIGESDRQDGMPATPPYAAIEQYGDGQVGFYTDVYALGVMAYALIKGEAPQDAQYRQSLGEDHTLDWHGLEVSSAIRDWITGATAIRATDRFADAESMLDALVLIQNKVSDMPNKSKAGNETVIVPQEPVRSDANGGKTAKKPFSEKLKGWTKKLILVPLIIFVIWGVIRFLLEPVLNPWNMVQEADKMVEACWASDRPSVQDSLFGRAKETYETALEEIRAVNGKSWSSFSMWAQKTHLTEHGETDYLVAKATAYFGLAKLHDPVESKSGKCVHNDTIEAISYYKKSIEISRMLDSDRQNKAHYLDALHNMARIEMNAEKAPKKAEERLKTLLEADPSDVDAKRKLIGLYYAWIYPENKDEAYEAYYAPLHEAEKISIKQNRPEYVARTVAYLNELGEQRNTPEQCALIFLKRKEGQARDPQGADRLCYSRKEDVKSLCPNLCPAN